MRRPALLQGIGDMRFENIYGRHLCGELTQSEAGELLGVGERTFRRWSARYREEGEDGLRDRRIGSAAANRVPDAVSAQVEALYRDRFRGFTAKHFHEHLARTAWFELRYTWTKLFLQSRGLIEAAPRRGAHRRRRPRRPVPGMMLHQDASRHVWVPGVPACDLVVTLDDATSAIYSAILVPEEGTASTFAGLLETFSDHGLPCSLYTDRGSHYFHTPVVGGRVSRTVRTQVGRALAQLGVDHIAAYSPEARGRSERAFRTLQDRLPKELARAGIGSVASANAWLRPTRGCGRCICRSTMRGLRWWPSSLARPLSRCPAPICARRCAMRRCVRWGRTTRWCLPGYVCRSRPARYGRIMCGRG